MIIGTLIVAAIMVILSTIGGYHVINAIIDWYYD